MPGVMMRCGHAAQGSRGGLPVCVACLGIVAGADVVDDAPPDLTGREAECPHCRRFEPSSASLPFFQFDPDGPVDSFYNGCRGWD